MKLTAARPSTDYAPTNEREVRRLALKAAANRRYRRRHLDPPADNLLPFRVPCPTPLGSKVYLEKRGSIAFALLGAVLR